MRQFHPKETKKDIIAAYHALEKEHDKVLDELAKFAPPEDESKAANGSSISAVAMALQGMQSALRNAVGGYQNAVANELLQLKELTDRKSQAEGELKTLHNIELNGGSTLPTLVQKYELQLQENSRAFEEFEKEAKEAAVARADAWEREQAQRDAFVQQREIDHATAVQREKEKYDYDTQCTRAADADEDVQVEKEFAAELRLITDTQREAWESREEALIARENDCTHLIDEEAQLERDLEKAIKAAEAQGENIAKRNAAMATRLARTAHQAELNQRDIELESLRVDSAQNSTYITSLEEQLRRITADNLALSQGALNSAERGAQQALEAMEKIATVQAQAVPGRK